MWNSLGELHQKLFGLGLPITRKELDTAEGRVRLTALVKEIGCSGLGLEDVLVDESTQLSRSLMKTTKCVVRVYVIEGFDFASRDSGSHSDPYLKLQLGEKTYNERDNYLQDESNPGFFKHYE